MQSSSRILLAASILVLAACSDNNNSVVVIPPPEYSVDPTTVDVSNADRCDITQPDECLFPFPNNYYTVGDSNSDTGLRVNLNAASIPGTAAGDVFDPTEVNRNDGFSTAGSLLVTVPGVDLGGNRCGGAYGYGHVTEFCCACSIDSRGNGRAPTGVGGAGCLPGCG